MNQIKKTTEIEKAIQRTLFYRRLAIGFGILVFLSLLVLGGIAVWQHFHESPFVPPSYETLNTESPDYWIGRTKVDIASAQNLGTTGNSRQLYRSLMNTLNQAKKISSQYEQFKAVSDIAITMAKNDVDINIDNIILELGDTPMATTARARILVSQGLMYLRVAKRPAARVAIQSYDRLVIDADLKLNSVSNELAFFGAVTALACLKDMDKLNEVFNRQNEFALRISTDQRMRAYRLVAGEQARVGMSVYALNTAQKIKNPIERVRAYQLIIFYTARPQKIEPVEPSVYTLQTTGPWEPLPVPPVAKQIINDVLKQIVSSPSLEEQIDVLTMLAGSRLMCDPELHQLLRESVANQSGINNIVKQPTLQHLDEPRSELIRASLKLPPLSKSPQRRIDTAADDWSSLTGAIDIEAGELKPTLMKELVDQQMIRVWLMTSQCYQMVGRYSDAVRVLRKAAAVAKKQEGEQFQNLLKIGEHFLSAGSFSDAHIILRNISHSSNIADKQTSAPGETSDTSAASSPQNQAAPELSVRVFQEQLSNLARLQIVGRFFDDALNTIKRIEPESIRNGDFAFLAMEQIRIARFDEAEKTIALLSDANQKQHLQHLTAIAKGGGEEHYDAVKIPFPEKLRDDSELNRCYELLMQNGLFGIAAKTAQKIGNSELQSKISARIVREYILLFKAYGEDSDWHRSVRESLLNSASSIAEKIVQPAARASAHEAILAGVLPFAYKEQRIEFLRRLFDEAFKTCRQIGVPENKAELMGRLILSKISLEAGEQAIANRFPLFDRTTKADVVDEIGKLITEAIDAVNESQDVPQTGYALSFLAKALGQIGRIQAAKKLLNNAEESARSLSDKQEAISVLLSLNFTYRALGDFDACRKIYSQVFTIVADSFIEMPNTAEATLEWRQRDSQLDRIIRSLLEHDFIAEAVAFANRINEPLLRDRLLRAAVYIYMDEDNFVSMENTARKIELPSVSKSAIQDVLFVKRRMVDKTNGEKPAE